jgi:Flp pilus assembly protein TadG
MKLLNFIRRNEQGAAAIEFAIAVPVLVSFIYGIFQVGLLFYANAGMQHALGEGARYTTLCLSPTATGCSVPTDTQITTKVNAELFGPKDGTFTVATPVTAGNSKTLTVTYTRTVKLLFIADKTITLTRTKKVYTVV